MSYPSDLKYTKDHEWVRISGDVAEIGITDFAQQQLGDVVFVDVPSAGARTTAGQPFGTIESVKAVSELFAPLTGDIVEVNSRLKHQPETINKDPHGAWIIKVRISEPAEQGTLLDSAAYESQLT